jgi:multisubunit Na+/H+ antiporter MnhB subunit
MSNKIAIVLLVCIGLVVLLAISELPLYGSPDTPAHNYVAERYIQGALSDTGALNMVAAIVIDYRGYDTLIETTVLFTAIIAVFLVLKKGTDRKGEQK